MRLWKVLCPTSVRYFVSPFGTTIYYKLDDSDFPSDSSEGRGHWVGIAENVGHAMTYKILTNDTKKVVYRSNVRSARNKRVDLLGGEEVPPIIKSLNDEDECPRKPMPIFDPTDLVGRTFLMDPQENGERYHTKILEVLVKSEEQLAKHLTASNSSVLSMITCMKRFSPTMRS